MKTIQSIDQLKKGDRIVSMHGDDVTYYEFLCVHPNNDQYVLMIESLSQEAKKIYIPKLLNNEHFLTDYTMNEIYLAEIDWHTQQIERLKERIIKKEE